MKRAATAVLLAAAIGVTTTAAAQAVTPDRAIKYRQGVLNAMNHHARLLNAVAKGDRPFNKDEVAMRTAYIDQLAHMPWEAFGPGTDQGAPTKAKPELWKDTAKFKQHQDKLLAETAKLAAAGRSGDPNQFKTAFGDTARACDACHDDFRAK